MEHKILDTLLVLDSLLQFSFKDKMIGKLLVLPEVVAVIMVDILGKQKIIIVIMMHHRQPAVLATLEALLMVQWKPEKIVVTDMPLFRIMLEKSANILLLKNTITTQGMYNHLLLHLMVHIYLRLQEHKVEKKKIQQVVLAVHQVVKLH